MVEYKRGNFMREENVLKYYVLCNRLKQVIRTGWKDWHVQANRLESVAEHVYSVQQLAIAMHSEYHYDLDLKKIILMLAIHELEETIIGDLTLFQIDAHAKLEAGHKAIQQALSVLENQQYLKEIIMEFDAKETPEARFAFFCDKLECDLQAKMYSETAMIDTSSNHQKDNISYQDSLVKEKLAQGKNFGQLWLEFSQSKYGYDDHFMAVSTYAMEHEISKLTIKAELEEK